jgi:hypothetical protein
VGAGGGIGLVGGALHLFYYKPARDNLASTTVAQCPNCESDWSTARSVTIAVYGLAAATVVTGLVLKLTVYKDRDAPTVGIVPTNGGGMLAVGWSR